MDHDGLDVYLKEAYISDVESSEIYPWSYSRVSKIRGFKVFVSKL